MATCDAKLEALASRAMTARKLIEAMDWISEQELKLHQDAEVQVVRARVEEGMRPFRSCPEIEEFMAQFARAYSEPKARYKMLLMRGSSRSGKTQKAGSLFGMQHTLVANCQGTSPDLPSIAAFDRSEHRAIVWDEIDHKQVLANKVCFQAGVDPVSLGQSKCNGYAYRRWLYATPMILRSNVFAWPQDKNTKLSAEDADWLLKNIIFAELPDGDKWYMDEEDEGE